MSWLDFFLGLPMVFFRIDGAIIFWASRGVPFWQNFLFAISWTSLTMVITYYGTEVMVNQFKKWWVPKILIEKWQKEIVARRNDFQKEEGLFSERTKIWLSRQKRLIILFLAFFPYTHFIPGFGSTIIITVRLLKVRHGIVILALGNAFRWAIITYHIYQAFFAIS